MMQMKKWIAFILALAITLSLAACGVPTAQNESAQGNKIPEKVEDMDREDKELIADLIGGEDASDLTDEELDELVQDLIGQPEDTSGIVNLGNKPQDKKPTVDTTDAEGVYDSDGAMTVPFDQAYPEAIEQNQVQFSGESILIKLESDKLTSGLKKAGIGALQQIVPLKGAAWYEAKLTQGTDPKEALAAVRELDEVLLAEYNYEIKTAALDDYKHFDKDKDEEFKKNGHNKDQWHFHHCGIVDGYEEMDKEGGDPSVIVAVIDSGVDYNHEDLKDNMWVNAKEIPDNGRDDDGNGYIDDYYGVDIIAGRGNGDDTNGHGTHVAGIIAARNNNVGVMGIAYNVKIMSVKAAMHNGTLNQADIAKAVLYAYSMGAEVINMSFGGTACSIAVQDALATAYTRCVLVAAAGNNGYPNEPTDYFPIPLPSYPAALTYVLGVMSVNEAGIESAFTNWDAYAFNGVEYELYAPGENIMSTLPGNKYGYLNGTSMAAPVVSAFAAILRSEFSDRDKYPTKFIYGQLSSTSEYHATCINPKLHMVNGRMHNLPQIVDLNAALTKLPKPEVHLQDYALFDDPKYSDKNNGDGVIDAGETIALGLTLRNRWGMSENTMVTIDTLSDISGMADPYFTIKNPTVDYGSVGTYSTQDAGRIYTDELLTGWEKPFIIEVSPDCPNDYRFTLNITVTCENALDEADTAIYTTKGKLNENVRAGYILPSVIEEDMVLTPENLYIIPNATIIPEGVTVKVQPGTHIQFWSDDANDPYADNYIAYLLVNGQFLVEGTKENPVYIYPSQLMDRYGVEIGSSSKGYVSLKYADITNFFYDNNHTGTGNNIDLADHCTFRYAYGSGYYYYRAVNEGNVNDHYVYSHAIGRINAKDCVFYKIGYHYTVSLYGEMNRCIFTQCGIALKGNYKNCVFLGNSLVDQTNPNVYMNSSADKSSIRLPREYDLKQNYLRIYYRPETGTTYVAWENGNSQFADYLREAFGGGYLKIETESEKAWLTSRFSDRYQVGARWDAGKGCYLWYDGTTIDLELFPELTTRLGSADHYISFSTYSGQLVYDYTNWLMYEIPGQILPEDIAFREYTVDMDLESTYQLAPQNTPVQLPATEFLYESTDEQVLTVSNTGLVTPVGLGTADVWVWSLDKAVKNRVTITIRDHVPLTGIAFPVKNAKLEVGASAYAACVLTPVDTTRHSVTYTSGDPSVVKVENGLLTAVGKGTATITATCEDQTATMEVTTWVRAASLSYKTYDHNRKAEECDNSLPELKVVPANADLDLEWSSSSKSVLSVVDGKLQFNGNGTAYLYATDKNSGQKATFYFTVSVTAPQIQKDVIAVQLGAEPMDLPAVQLAAGAETTPIWQILDPGVAVIENGKIVFKGAGIATLRVTDPRNGLTDEIFIHVSEDAPVRIKELQTADGDRYYQYALLEDGRLYGWYTGGSNDTGAKAYLVYEGVKAFDIYGGYVVALLEDNTIVAYYSDTDQLEITELKDTPLKDVAGCYYGKTSTSNVYFALAEDGTVYARGNNSYGQLGIGNNVTANEFAKVAISAPVKQVAYDRNTYTAYYLTEKGDLYISGGSSLWRQTPVIIAKNVSWLDQGGKYYVTDDHFAYFDGTEPVVGAASLAGYTMLDAWYYYIGNSLNFAAMAAKGNEVYKVYSDGSVSSSPVLRLHTPVIAGGIVLNYNIYSVTNNVNAYYAVTEEGVLLAGGRRYYSDYTTNAFLGMTPKIYVDVNDPLYLPVGAANDVLTVVETNLDERKVLSGDVLQLQLNKKLLYAGATIYENGEAMIAHTAFTDNQMEVNPTIGFTDGASYRVVIAVSDIRGIGVTKPAENIILEFTYKAPVVETPEETTPEETTPEETLPDGTAPEKVVYESILDETIQRYWTRESLLDDLYEYIAKTQYNPQFNGNAILNPISTDFEVSHWLRIQAPEVTVGEYSEIPLGGNYWGSVNDRAIGLQLIDYTDFPNYARLMYAPFLQEAPENTFPFVTSVKLFNKYGEEVTTVGNEEVKFQVKFNRDMDTSIDLLVRFGSAYPYGDYEIEGQYVDARTWEGTYTLNTLIENGYQYFSISNGCSATEDLPLQWDQYRFFFEIDTTAAQALIMQGTALDTGVELKWTQDDFQTLMGYNVYRSTKEDGLYTRLNKTVIPAETMEWFDDTVEPGVVYYYNFTVVQTDMAESEPSGKIVIMSKDTMAPDIYHSPVSSAFTGANLVLTATVTDNLNISYANLYYRVTGTEEWNTIRMNKLNDKYSAIIPAQYVTVDGIEYYIEAFDGVSFTYKGKETPYTVAVQEALDENSLGDVDGDGVITNLDALKLLYTINDKYNMTAEEFARADLNSDGELWAAEALRILQYVSGVVGSVKM